MKLLATIAALMLGAAVITGPASAATSGMETADEDIFTLYWTNARVQGERGHAATFDVFDTRVVGWRISGQTVDANLNRIANQANCEDVAGLLRMQSKSTNSTADLFIYWCEPGRFHKEAV